MLAGFAGQHVVSFEDLNIDLSLEVQNKRYSQILYLIGYVVPGLHFWKKNRFPGKLSKTEQKNRSTNKYPDLCWQVANVLATEVTILRYSKETHTPNHLKVPLANYRLRWLKVAFGRSVRFRKGFGIICLLFSGAGHLNLPYLHVSSTDRHNLHLKVKAAVAEKKLRVTRETAWNLYRCSPVSFLWQIIHFIAKIMHTSIHAQHTYDMIILNRLGNFA